MKRSSAVKLTLITSIAALCLDCANKRPVRYCVDAQGKVIDEKYCTGDQAKMYASHWYYVSSQHGRFGTGTPLSGGSATMPREGFVTPSEASPRGFFGEAGEAASSGHASIGEGHAGGAGAGE